MTNRFGEAVRTLPATATLAYYVAKFDQDGELLWSATIDPAAIVAGVGITAVTTTACGINGRVAVGVRLLNTTVTTVRLNNGSSFTAPTISTIQGGYTLLFDTNGALLWTAVVESNEIGLFDIAMDTVGNVVIGGRYGRPFGVTYQGGIISILY